MTKNAHKSFDFDDWSKLASTDPVAFENRRQQIINQFILAAPEPQRQRLQCLQWRIDQTRRLSSNSITACIKLSQMMMDSVLGESGLLEALRSMDMELNSTVRPHTHSAIGICRKTAKVLQFRSLDKASGLQ